MKKSFILIAIIFLVSFKQSDKKIFVSYITTENNIATIELKLFTDNTFNLYMKDYYDSSITNSTGIWKINNSKYRLTFNAIKFHLGSLFSEDYDLDDDGFKIISEKILDINSQNKILGIRGLNCQKQELTASEKTDVTNNTTTDKNKLYAEKAIADLILYIKKSKLKNEAMDKYELTNPYINQGVTILCNQKKTNFVIVSFKGKNSNSYAYIFYQINQKGDVISSIQTGFTIDLPASMYKDALRANETDYWYCMGDDEGRVEPIVNDSPQQTEIIGHASYANNKGKYYKNQKWKFIIDQYYFQPIYVENTLSNRIHLTYSMLPLEPDNGTPTVSFPILGPI